MGTSRLVKTLAGTFQHQTHRNVHFSESLKLTSSQGARITVRIKIGFPEHQLTHLSQIVNGALVTVVLEPYPELQLGKKRWKVT